MENIKVAIIGAGNMGRQHTIAFNNQPNASVVGIFSRTKSKAEILSNEFKIPIVANSIDELYEKTKADLAIVAVPELSLNNIAKECFSKNWSVLLEKPAGYNIEDAQDIAAAAMDCQGKVVVGFNRRSYSSTSIVFDDLAELPESRFVHVQDQQSYAEARAHNHPEKVVENFMYANSVHLIDYISYFCRGNIESVNHIMPWKGENTEIMLAHIKYDSGDSALYEGIWKGPGPWACSISTPSRRWTMQPLETACLQKQGQREVIRFESNNLDKQFKPGLFKQAEEVIKHISGKNSNVVTISESMRTMKLINKIFQI